MQCQKMNGDELRETVARNLRTTREAADLSQEEVSRALRVATQKISSYETGQSLPSLRRALELAQFYGVTLDEICGVLRQEVFDGKENG